MDTFSYNAHMKFLQNIFYKLTIAYVVIYILLCLKFEAHKNR